MLELPHVRDMNTGQHQAHVELLSKQKLELKKQLMLQESISTAAHIVILHMDLINAGKEHYSQRPHFGGRRRSDV